MARKHLSRPHSTPELHLDLATCSETKKGMEQNIFIDIKSKKKKRLLAFYIASYWVFWTQSVNRRDWNSYKTIYLETQIKEIVA